MANPPCAPPATGLVAAALLLLVAATACTTRPVRFVAVVPSTAQARSFLGDTLYTIPLDATEGQRRVRLLQQARDRVSQRPHSTPDRLLLGLRTEGIGRFREAIGIYTEAMAENPREERVHRRRGEALLRIRELDRAASDLRFAVQQSLSSREPDPELNESGDGRMLVPTTTLHSSLFYLGLTLYLDGNFEEARNILGEALRRAPHEDQVAATTFWLFLTTRRLGLHQEAGTLLDTLRTDLQITTTIPEYALLLAYRGDVEQELLPVNLGGPYRTRDDITYAYGIGFVLLMLERTEEAALIFRRIRATTDWSLLPYLAAEAELARIEPVEGPAP